MMNGRGPFPPSRPFKYIIPTCTITLICIMQAIFSLSTVSQSWRQLMTLPAARIQQLSVASTIVHQTHQHFFSYLTTDCPIHTTMEHCLERARRNENKTVPWWFQTMLRDALLQGGVSGPWHHQSAPNVTNQGKGLEFCAIEKVGTKHWRRFFCHLRREKQDEKRPFCAHETLPEDSPRVVFLRDPLERYLSAYMDK